MITRDALASLILDLEEETNYNAEEFARKRLALRVNIIGSLPRQHSCSSEWERQYDEWSRMSNQQQAAVLIAEAIQILKSARVYL
jgi:NADPH-dependent glutamate synthase beta subunit-like oxidoreductase